MAIILKDPGGLEWDAKQVNPYDAALLAAAGIEKSVLDVQNRFDVQKASNLAQEQLAIENKLKTDTFNADSIYKTSMMNKQVEQMRIQAEANKVNVSNANDARIAQEEFDKLRLEAEADTRFEAGFYKQQEIDAAADIAKDEELTTKQNRTAKQLTIDADKQKKKYADKAALVAGYTYDKQQEYLNNSSNDPTEKLAVRALWKANPSLYGEANNNNNYSVENQGMVDKFGKDGIATLADEKTYNTLSKGIMSSDDKVSLKALNTAKEVIPNVDKVLPGYVIYEKAGALATKLGYRPGMLNTISAHTQGVVNFYGNVLGKNTMDKTNNDEQIVLLTQMVDSLPTNSPDRVEAEELLFEAKETSLALREGRQTVSAAQINRRLKKSQYGLSSVTRTTKKTKEQSILDKALATIKNSKLSPEEVAEAISK